MKYEDHPIAAIFPMIPEQELGDLAASIAKHGQRDPIILLEGKILDGRNRYRACQLAKVEPAVRVFDPKQDGGSPLALVLDLNLTRRHLSTGQRAAIAASCLKYEEEQKPKIEVLPDPPKQEETNLAGGKIITPKKEEPKKEEPKPEAKKTTNKEAAAKAGVSQRSLVTAKKIEKENPELFAKVQSGEITLNEAENEIERAKQKKQRQEAMGRVTGICGKTFAEAMDKNTILKTVKEVAAFLALSDEEMKECAPLIATGWTVKRASQVALNKIGTESTVGDLINKAIATGSNELTTEVNGWEISAMKVN